MPGAPGPDGLAGSPDPGIVGRAAEVATVRRLLGGARLVTVTGLPGVGKTAVGLAAASAAAGSFADGSLLLRLDALRDETLLPHTIAAALQLPDDFTRGRLPVLAEQLRDRHLLLVLDTCEHLLGACACAGRGPAARLPQVAGPGDQPGAAPGAGRGHGGGPPAAAGGRGGPVRPAGGAGRGRDRTGAPGRGGLGLRAAGQAAAGHRAGHWPAGRTAARRGGPAARPSGWPGCWPSWRRGTTCPRGDGEPGRHRTLRAAIGWSHELCTPSERLLWARLSVFTGPFGRADAQDVCASDQLPGGTVAASLSLLAERSVLLASRLPDGSTSYLLPATLRAYGRRMLRRLGQEEEFTARHQRWQDGRRPQHGAPAGK